MTETQAGDLLEHGTGKRRTARWQAAVGLLGLIGLGIAVVTTVDDVQGRALPGIWAFSAALVLSFVGVAFAGAAWAVLFPPQADRRALVSALYTSQLTKYLPAGGVVQVASQVALAGRTSGVAVAALRLPVYSMCMVCAGLSLGSLLALHGSLPAWLRLLAGLGILSPLVLDRRVLGAVLRRARRLVHRLPSPDRLPGQGQILRSYAYSLATLGAYAATFTVLLDGVTDVGLVPATAALCMGWVIGYLVAPVPSGIGVREAVLIAVLPSLGAGPLLTASLAHRLLGIVAEAGLAGVAVARLNRSRPRPRPAEGA